MGEEGGWSLGGGVRSVTWYLLIHPLDISAKVCPEPVLKSPLTGIRETVSRCQKSLCVKLEYSDQNS
jgi:hypothetical protein